MFQEVKDSNFDIHFPWFISQAEDIIKFKHKMEGLHIYRRWKQNAYLLFQHLSYVFYKCPEEPNGSTLIFTVIFQS